MLRTKCMHVRVRTERMQLQLQQGHAAELRTNACDATPEWACRGAPDRTHAVELSSSACPW
eukprot:3323160-Alexandrium_andersonii.AAC.1